MAMRDILFPECVITHMKAKSKEDALHQLYEVLLKNGKVKTSFYDAVLERERDYPTGLELEEYNAAIPHVVPAHVEHSAMGIASWIRLLRSSAWMTMKPRWTSM